jgi:hypothetical protein
LHCWKALKALINGSETRSGNALSIPRRISLPLINAFAAVVKGRRADGRLQLVRQCVPADEVDAEVLHDTL